MVCCEKEGVIKLTPFRQSLICVCVLPNLKKNQNSIESHTYQSRQNNTKKGLASCNGGSFKYPHLTVIYQKLFEKIDSFLLFKECTCLIKWKLANAGFQYYY